MKKLFTICALLLLSSCTDDTLHVDLQGELNTRPIVSLTLEDGTEIAGFPWSYCTDVVCFDKEPIDFAALNYAPFNNGSKLTFTVTFSDAVNMLGVRTYDKTGEVTHRELPYTVIDDHTFLFEEPFPEDESEVALNIKVDFVNEGLAHYYFPLKLE